MVVRPTLLYDIETVPTKKRHEAELKVAEMKMLSFSLGRDKLEMKILKGQYRRKEHRGVWT